MDKITKALKKLSLNEQKQLKIILMKIKETKFEGLDLKKLKGRDNIFRIRKGSLRIIFLLKNKNIRILSVERRSDNTYS